MSRKNHGAEAQGGGGSHRGSAHGIGAGANSGAGTPKKPAGNKKSPTKGA